MQQGVLNQRLEDAARKLWPGVRSRCEFRPSMDAAEGHFSTDFCVQLSSEVNLDPQIIGARLLEAFQAEEGVSFVQNRNFIALHFEPCQINERHFRSMISIPPCEETVIVIPEYLSTASPIAYLRVASLAWEHFSLIKAQGVKCTLHVGEKCYASDESLDAYRSLLMHLAGTTGAEVSGALEHLRTAVSKAAGRKVFLWFSSDSMPKADFQAFYREAVHRQPRHVLCCPDPNWAMSAESLMLPEYLKEAAPKELYSYMLYICSAVPAVDLDHMVPHYAEKNNLLWFLSSLLERIERLEKRGSGAEENLEKGLCSADVPAISSKLLLLCAQYPFFASRAFSFGDLEQYNRIIGQMADFMSIALNQPLIRLALCGDSEHAEAEIIYSVSRMFSAIISWCCAEQ